MYHRWLDRWDERCARRSDDAKPKTEFVLNSKLAFSATEGVTSVTELGALADRALADRTFFSEPDGASLDFEWDDGWIRFPSSLPTDIEENNTVWARVEECGSPDHALVVFHHWNATSRYPQLARFFARRGITVVEIAMPYHMERSRPSSLHADYMLSSDLGRTIQSMRQAVLDGRKLITVLRNVGYGKISVLGMSLGSWVAGLVAAHEPTVGRAALLLTAGSLADMVWTGRATRHIRASLESQVELGDLRRAWGPFNLERHAGKLARTDLDLQLVLARRDTVVLPRLSAQLVAALEGAGARADVLALNCGHYSLTLPPYIVLAGRRVSRMLTDGR